MVNEVHLKACSLLIGVIIRSLKKKFSDHKCKHFADDRFGNKHWDRLQDPSRLFCKVN